MHMICALKCQQHSAIGSAAGTSYQQSLHDMPKACGPPHRPAGLHDGFLRLGRSVSRWASIFRMIKRNYHRMVNN